MGWLPACGAFSNRAVAVVLAVLGLMLVAIFVASYRDPLRAWLDARDVVPGLDPDMRYVINARRAAETKAEEDPTWALGPFAAPTGQGSYGRMDNSEARAAFNRLQAARDH